MPRVTIPLQSSALSSASYDADSEELELTFTSGRRFTYSNVPQDVFEGLRDAPSPGSYYNSNIKDVYS